LETRFGRTRHLWGVIGDAEICISNVLTSVTQIWRQNFFRLQWALSGISNKGLWHSDSKVGLLKEKTARWGVQVHSSGVRDRVVHVLTKQLIPATSSRSRFRDWCLGGARKVTVCVYAHGSQLLCLPFKYHFLMSPNPILSFNRCCLHTCACCGLEHAKLYD